MFSSYFFTGRSYLNHYIQKRGTVILAVKITTSSQYLCRLFCSFLIGKNTKLFKLYKRYQFIPEFYEETPKLSKITKD